MKRRARPTKLTDAIVIAAQDGKRRGESRERLAKRLGVSTGTISTAWGMARPLVWAAPVAVKAPPVKSAPVARPPVAPEPAPTARLRDPVRAALLANLDAAETCAAVNAADLELARHDDPFLASRLDCGDSLVSALVIAGHAVQLVTTAEHFADLARFVTSDPLVVVREDGEPLAAHRRTWRAARAAQQLAAVELLKGALEIVESSAPTDYPKDREP